MMTAPKRTSEPFEISRRFHSALWAKVVSLEANAQKDELFAAALHDLGHFQRQTLLVQAQRDDAGRFRNFLARTRIRA
jgi:predicted HD phosphohydrolase